MSNEPRIIRSMSFAPAHQPESLLAAADAGLDAVGADLEDLTPRAAKQRARDVFREVARELTAKGTLVMARTNNLDQGCEEDLHAIVCPELHCVNVPKATSAEQIHEFCRLLDQAEAANGVPVGSTLVRPVVETAAGVRNAYEVAAASPRITYMGGVAGSIWGDLGATLGSMIGPDGMDSYYIRSKVIVDVRAAGARFPIGGGSISRTDPDSVREFAWQNRRLGYTGQYTGSNRDIVRIINDVYTPLPEEVAHWKAALPELEQAELDGTVCITINGTFYDTAGIQRMRDLLELAERVGVGTA